MTTLAPVIDLVGDIGEFSCFVYGGSRWVAYLRQTGALELHRSGDGLTEFIDIDVAYPKRQVSVAVLGSELCIAWTQSTTQEIYFSKWHMGLRVYTQAPTLLWVGSSPALAVCKTNWLVMGYRDSAGQHVYRTSANVGVTWTSPSVVIDADTITEVGVDVYPSTSNQVYWAETAEDNL